MFHRYQQGKTGVSFWSVFLGAGISFQILAPTLEKALFWISSLDVLIHRLFEGVACVASVSNRVIARKLERKRSPSPVISFFFALVPTFSTNSRGNACYAGYWRGRPSVIRMNTRVAFDWEIRISDFAIERKIRKRISPPRNPSSGWISIKKSKSGFHGFPFCRSTAKSEKGFAKLFSWTAVFFLHLLIIYTCTCKAAILKTDF